MGFVQVGESIFCVHGINTGCIQGSIVGPILFNIYTSDLVQVIHPNKVICYADDSHVVVAHENLEDIKNDLIRIITVHAVRFVTALNPGFFPPKKKSPRLRC